MVIFTSIFSFLKKIYYSLHNLYRNKAKDVIFFQQLIYLLIFYMASKWVIKDTLSKSISIFSFGINEL